MMALVTASAQAQGDHHNNGEVVQLRTRRIMRPVRKPIVSPLTLLNTEEGTRGSVVLDPAQCTGEVPTSPTSTLIRLRMMDGHPTFAVIGDDELVDPWYSWFIHHVHTHVSITITPVIIGSGNVELSLQVSRPVDWNGPRMGREIINYFLDQIAGTQPEGSPVFLGDDDLDTEAEDDEDEISVIHARPIDDDLATIPPGALERLDEDEKPGPATVIIIED